MIALGPFRVPGLLRTILLAAGAIPGLPTAWATDQGTTVERGSCRLTLDVPDGFAAQPRGKGVVLRPIGQASRRAVFEITLTPESGGDPASLSEIRTLGGTYVRYRVTRLTEGSGGEESTLVAEKPGAGGVIRLEAWTQRDDGAEPDFEPAWQALSAAGCARADPR